MISTLERNRHSLMEEAPFEVFPMDHISVAYAIKSECSLIHSLARSLPQPACAEFHAIGDRIWREAKKLEDYVFEQSEAA